MDKLIKIASAIVLLAACTRESAPEDIIGQDDLVVTIEDVNVATKTVLNGQKTAFVSGDKIKVYDSAGKSAVYFFRAKSGEASVFQQESFDTGFDKSKSEAAFYPASGVKSYDHSTNTFTVQIADEQKFAEGSFSNGGAPMACFSIFYDGESKQCKASFSNCFAVIRFGFKYESLPAAPLTIGSIELSASHYLSGEFTVSKISDDEISVTHKSGGGKTLTLTGCDALGALGTSDKYYYIALPGLASGTSDITVKATPTKDVPFSGKFTATTGETNKLVKNNILQMNPFVLKPIDPGVGTSYELLAWNNTSGNISVGQITLSSSEVSVNVGGFKDIQIFGVSDWDKITTDKLSGIDKFNISKKTDGGKYYVTIEGAASGSGQAFVNDAVTNSGSYINITVN